MIWHVQDEWHYMVVVRSHLQVTTLTADNSLVQLSSVQLQPLGSSSCNTRSSLKNKNAEILARVACDQGIFAGTNLFRLPEQHGHYGGYKSEGEAGEELLDSFDKELDGVAFRPSNQFQVGSTPSPSPGRQCCLTGLETATSAI